MCVGGRESVETVRTPSAPFHRPTLSSEDLRLDGPATGGAVATRSDEVLAFRRRRRLQMPSVGHLELPDTRPVPTAPVGDRAWPEGPSADVAPPCTSSRDSSSCGSIPHAPVTAAHQPSRRRAGAAPRAGDHSSPPHRGGVPRRGRGTHVISDRGRSDAGVEQARHPGGRREHRDDVQASRERRGRADGGEPASLPRTAPHHSGALGVHQWCHPRGRDVPPGALGRDHLPRRTRRDRCSAGIKVDTGASRWPALRARR